MLTVNSIKILHAVRIRSAITAIAELLVSVLWQTFSAATVATDLRRGDKI